MSTWLLMRAIRSRIDGNEKPACFPGTSQSTLVHRKHRRRNNMDIGWKSARAFIALASLSIFWSACQQDGGLSTTAPSTSPALSKTAGHTNGALAAQGSVNGAAGQMPAYYEGELFTVNMKELPQTASASIIAKNRSLNEIF